MATSSSMPITVLSACLWVLLHGSILANAAPGATQHGCHLAWSRFNHEMSAGYACGEKADPSNPCTELCQRSIDKVLGACRGMKIPATITSFDESGPRSMKAASTHKSCNYGANTGRRLLTEGAISMKDMVKEKEEKQGHAKVHPDDALEARDAPRQNPPPENIHPGAAQAMGRLPITTDEHVDEVPGHEDVLICKDLDEACVDWAQSGECQANPSYMRETCPRSCGICNGGRGFVHPDGPPQAPPCVDGDVECVAWAEAGECEGNAEFMHTTCKKACGVCDGEKARDDL